MIDDLRSVAWQALLAIAVPAVAFGLLTLALRGRATADALRRAWPQTKTNLGLYAIDALLFAPLLGVLAAWLATQATAGTVPALPASTWQGTPVPLLVLATVVAGDFIGYWRHRLEHSRWLWPAHAVHHADTEVTWLTVTRFHPVNRVSTTLVDNLALALLGFPPAALAVNAILRHWYGALVHADLPWTWGPLRHVLVSPAMHRWHHSRRVHGSNFATVFSIWDRLFGTWYDGGPCTSPLGAPGSNGLGVLAQLAWPFRAWGELLRRRRGDAGA